MIQQKITFGIDRKEISHFTKIKLTQTINDHHFFKITVPQAVIEAQMVYTITKSQDWIGKTVHIQLENQNNFLGVIKYVNLIQKGDHVGNQIEISGYSKTDLLNSGKKRYSWENCTLKEIVESVLKKGVGNYRELKNQINPEYKHEIKYQTQYNETDFEFLQRLAKQYKEWFYYDCEMLFFGKPDKFDKTINLLFASDLSHLKIALQAVPHKLSGYTYDENTDTLYKTETNEEIEGLTQLGKHVFKASAELYNTPDATQERISAGNEAGLEHSLNRKMQSIASESEYVIARSSNPKLKIGSLIAISAQERLNTYANYSDKNFNPSVAQYTTHGVGAYIITEITHKATDIGEYENRFKALPAHITKLPEPQIDEPIAKSQEALVIANNDPMGYGRIRVRMQWQYGGMQTPWLRVMSADAGTSADVPTNRGNVSIPEVGDHVALNFWDDDPNKPFVIGSLFTGKTGKGGGANNDFRTITDGSGNHLELEKHKNIRLEDLKENGLHVDSVGDTLNLKALDTINIYAKNINFIASENLTANVGNTMTFNVVKTAFFNIFQKMQVNTPYLHQLITGLFHTNASKALINSDNEIKLESPEMHLAGQKKLFMHSDEQAIINSKGTAEVHGTQGNKQSNEAVSHEAVKEITDAKAIVVFRPNPNWNGEFLFDWMRTGTGEKLGQTTIVGDVDYSTILGYYRNNSTSNPFVGDTAGANSNGEKVLYEKLKKEYQSYIFSGVVDENNKPTPYLEPVLGIYKHECENTKAIAMLQLQIQVIEKPDELILEYDGNCFDIRESIDPSQSPVVITSKKPTTITPYTNPNPSIKKLKLHRSVTGDSFVTADIEIEAIGTLSNPQRICAYTIMEDPNCPGEKIKKLAGTLKVLPNDNKNRKIVNVVLINVITDIDNNPTTVESGLTAKLEEQKATIRKVLRQAMIDPVFTVVDLDLSGTNDKLTNSIAIRNHFNRTYVVNGSLKCYYDGRASTLPAGWKNMEDYLSEQLIAQKTSKYNNYKKVFFMAQHGYSIDKNNAIKVVAGYTSGDNPKNIVIVSNSKASTSSHELLHSLGIAHTWESKNHQEPNVIDKTAPQGLHSFEHLKTSNIMDYSDPRLDFIYAWQAKLANNKAIAEPTNYTPAP